MPRDEVNALVLVGSLATWGTLHVVTAWGLVRVGPWWRGPVAFVVLPLAPYWAFTRGLRVRAVVWVIAGALWGVARTFLAR